MVRAIEALAICVTLFLSLFASQYVAESLADGSAFSQPLDKFSALYDTTTVFSTVGFGDITPVSDVARALTMAQMIGNIIVLGVGFRILTSVAREGLERKRLAARCPTWTAARGLSASGQTCAAAATSVWWYSCRSRFSSASFGNMT